MKKRIIKDRGSVYGDTGVWEILEEELKEMAPSKVFILTDENTRQACLPYFMEQYSYHKEPVLLSIQSGESYKNIDTCLQLWNELSSQGADRKSLLINLGGGVVTDLGGFVACTFQRGIEFINVPTSLLAMVDASVGGKNGVDLGTLKNQVGVIKNPKSVLVDTYFLSTLPKEQFRSGQAEMIKHGLIHSESYLNRVLELDADNTKQVQTLVWESIEIKNAVVTKDPFEQGLRKTLNYGHTLGHAIESYFLSSPHKPLLLHGEAIAIGMILATHLSKHLFDFPEATLRSSTDAILKIYGRVEFTEDDIPEIIKLLIFDKKNTDGQIQFVLLNSVGQHRLNCIVPDELIYAAFNFYKNFHF